MESQLPFGVEVASSTPPGTGIVSPPFASQVAEIVRLRAELERARNEQVRLLETQRRIMELLGTKSPDKVLHDLRNVLNERSLFKALFETQSS